MLPPSDAAELSSTVAQLEDLAQRVEAIADRYVGSDREDVATRLFEVERAIATAARRLEVVQRSL